jgi:hypothetical protein
MSRILLTITAAVPLLLISGCPEFIRPAAILAGDWETNDEDGNTAMVRFDDSGTVIGILIETDDGTMALIMVENSTTVVDSDDVTVTIPTPNGEAVYNATLSADQNTLTGTVDRVVELGDNVIVRIPQGDLVLTRILDADPCTGVMCNDGEECVDGQCVAADPCAGVMCDEGEACVDGECVAMDPCADVNCDEGDECIDGECVAMDPCADVNCDEGDECIDGECVAMDPCADINCDDGEECIDGECVATDPCADVTCNDGEDCVDGECIAVDPCDVGGEVNTGMTFYTANGCNNCHGANAEGGAGPTLIGLSCDLIFDNLSGADPHPVTVNGMTRQDAADLKAYLDSL